MCPQKRDTTTTVLWGGDGCYMGNDPWYLPNLTALKPAWGHFSFITKLNFFFFSLCSLTMLCTFRENWTVCVSFPTVQWRKKGRKTPPAVEPNLLNEFKWTLTWVDTSNSTMKLRFRIWSCETSSDSKITKPILPFLVCRDCCVAYSLHIRFLLSLICFHFAVSEVQSLWFEYLLCDMKHSIMVHISITFSCI